MGVCLQRLLEERKEFRKNRPFGFSAKPKTLPDGSADMLTWECIVPGKDGTACQGANYPCTLIFSEDYPTSAPKARMPKGFFHVNVCPKSGGVCLSILKDDVPSHLGIKQGWTPSLTVMQVLTGIQELLHTPNFRSVLGKGAYEVYSRGGIEAYNAATRKQARMYSS